MYNILVTSLRRRPVKMTRLTSMMLNKHPHHSPPVSTDYIALVAAVRRVNRRWRRGGEADAAG